MNSSLTKHLIKALYDYSAENNLPRLHVRCVFSRLVMTPAVNNLAKFVDNDGSIILNIHVAAAKDIQIQDNGLFFQLSCKGQIIDVFAPWVSFVDCNLFQFKVMADEGETAIGLPMILGRGFLDVTGFPLMHKLVPEEGEVTVVEKEAPKEKEKTKPTLKVVK